MALIAWALCFNRAIVSNRSIILFYRVAPVIEGHFAHHGRRPFLPPTALPARAKSCPHDRDHRVSALRTGPVMTPKLKLLHLAELQLDRGRSAEDRHRHLHARAAFVDFLDRAVERG